MKTEALSLEALFSFDSEAGMFCAHGGDRTALERLGTLMSAVATDHNRMHALIKSAKSTGFEFDD